MADAENNEVEWDPENAEIVRVEGPNEEEEIQIPRNDDGSLDGGVANGLNAGPESNQRTALDCDLVSIHVR